MTTQVDQARADAFAGQALEMLNHASLTFLTSVGQRTGLLDTMGKLDTPATSQGIANAAGLQERYVREWLGGMVTGGIVEYDRTSRTYRLPPEHAASLTRAAGINNMASWAEALLVLSQVEDQVVESFRHGGGVPYSAYPRFQTIMAQLSGQVFDAALLDTILPLVPGLPERLQQGIRVADIGCGSGHAINLMARAYPNSRFVGFDFSEEGIGRARAEASAWGLTNAEFVVRDVSELGTREEFDFITSFDAIHDQAHPADVLQGIATALKPDGVYLMVDEGGSSELADNTDFPLAPMLYTVSTFHCMTVSLALGGDGLGTMWGEQKARQMLAEAGFKNVTVSRVEGDIENNYYVARKQ
jgi:SAM-dependent methyltransferase